MQHDAWLLLYIPAHFYKTLTFNAGHTTELFLIKSGLCLKTNFKKKSFGDIINGSSCKWSLWQPAAHSALSSSFSVVLWHEFRMSKASNARREASPTNPPLILTTILGQQSEIICENLGTWWFTGGRGEGRDRRARRALVYLYRFPKCHRIAPCLCMFRMFRMFQVSLVDKRGTLSQGVLHSSHGQRLLVQN